jgi:predicted nucleic acid-binding protein
MSPSGSDRRVFVDTSVYYAIADQDDASHATAAATMRRLSAERRRLVTTNAVLFETHSLLVNRIGHQVARNVLVALRASQTIVRVRRSDEERAEEILAQYADKDFSLTDALSFAVMERLGIRVAFSLDRHFVQYGWQIIDLDDRR